MDRTKEETHVSQSVGEILLLLVRSEQTGFHNGTHAAHLCWLNDSMLREGPASTYMGATRHV